MPASVDMFPTQKQKLTDDVIKKSFERVPAMALAQAFHHSDEPGLHSLYLEQFKAAHPDPSQEKVEEDDEMEEDADKVYKISRWLKQAHGFHEPLPQPSDHNEPRWATCPQSTKQPHQCRTAMTSPRQARYPNTHSCSKSVHCSIGTLMHCSSLAHGPFTHNNSMHWDHALDHAPIKLLHRLHRVAPKEACTHSCAHDSNFAYS